MTVQNETNREDYNGDGVQTNFPVSFYFLDDTHLQVIHVAADNTETQWILNSDYTVNGAGDIAGGSIDAAVAPLSGERVVILRKVPQTQLIDYIENDSFPAETHELGLDKLTMLIQEMQEVLNRTYQETPGGNPSGEFLPSGTRIIIYNDSPPLNWSLVDTGDCVVAISNGSDKLYSGASPGDPIVGDFVVDVDGTSLAHALSVAELPVHNHDYLRTDPSGVQAGNEGTPVGEGIAAYTAQLTGAVGGNSGHTHGISLNITHRPKGLPCMVIERD